MANTAAAIHRLFSETRNECLDDLGFLDRGRTPRLVKFDTVLVQPLAWVLGPPWVGKSTVAGSVRDWLRGHPDAFGGIESRFALTPLESPHAVHDLPPAWWNQWSRESPPRPAVWLVDGVEEDVQGHQVLLNRILDAVAQVSIDHLRHLHLILFSRPYDELADFRSRLQARYVGISEGVESPQFWLARLDRETAQRITGADRFSRVLEVIRRNDLSPVAGYPVVTKLLAKYPESAAPTIPDVWRAVLHSLLGEGHSPLEQRFRSSVAERFDACCRMAAVLTLTDLDRILLYSPDSQAATVAGLFQTPDNRLDAAAREACRTAAMVMLPEEGAFRFAQRNIQDWFTAFAIERLPVPALRSALSGQDGTLVVRLMEPARLVSAITSRREVREELERLSGGRLLPSDAAPPTLAQACRQLDHLEELARNAAWGIRWEGNAQKELARFAVNGLGNELAQRLRDPRRPLRVKQLLFEVAEATQASEVADPAVELFLDSSQPADLRVDAMRFLVRFGGDDHLRRIEDVAKAEGSRPSDSEERHRISGILRRLHVRDGQAGAVGCLASRSPCPTR